MASEHHIFYFTYGTSGQPFRGGWTEVHVLSLGATGCDQSQAAHVNCPDASLGAPLSEWERAIELFNEAHPPRSDGLVNCAGIYDEAAFRKTGMLGNGNFGKRCVEKILEV